MTAVLSPERWAEVTAASSPRPASSPVSRAGAPRRELRAGEIKPPDKLPVDARRADSAVKIDFLGPVQVSGAGVELERRRRLTELVVYLAFHPEGVSGQALATALWPERRVSLQTVSNRLYEARRALGTGSDGQPRISRVEGRHRLSDDVKSDWEHFASLTGPGSSPASWHRALSMVRGRPFDGLSQGEWVGLEGAAAHIEAEIVEVAGRLGEHLLQQGDSAGAAWAARKGIAAAPWDERLYRLLMRAADASGNRGAVESALRWLADALEWEGDPLEAVHPDTARLYRELAGPPR